MGDKLEIMLGTDPALPAVMSDPGATVGDVLTVQTDRSIAAAPSGGGSQPAPVVVSIQWTDAPAGFSQINQISNNIVGGESYAGAAIGIVTYPFAVVAMGGEVISPGDLVLSTSGIVPSTPDDLDLDLYVFVSDATGLNQAHTNVSTSVSEPVTDTSGELTLADATWTISVGTDLTDGGSGELDSTAGGTYQVSIACKVSWD